MGVVTAEAATAAVGLGFALLKGGCLSASLSHATVRLTCSLGQSLRTILVTPQKSLQRDNPLAPLLTYARTVPAFEQ